MRHKKQLIVLSQQIVFNFRYFILKCHLGKESTTLIFWVFEGRNLCWLWTFVWIFEWWDHGYIPIWTKGFKYSMVDKTWSTGCFVWILFLTPLEWTLFSFCIQVLRKPSCVAPRNLRTFIIALWGTVPYKYSSFPVSLNYSWVSAHALLLSHKCSNSS